VSDIQEAQIQAVLKAWNIGEHHARRNYWGQYAREAVAALRPSPKQLQAIAFMVFGGRWRDGDGDPHEIFQGFLLALAESAPEIEKP
jgi:hypothetical protein